VARNESERSCDKEKEGRQLVWIETEIQGGDVGGGGGGGGDEAPSEIGQHKWPSGTGRRVVGGIA